MPDEESQSVTSSAEESAANLFPRSHVAPWQRLCKLSALDPMLLECEVQNGRIVLPKRSKPSRKVLMTLSASGICEIPIETDHIVFMWRRSATARKRQHGMSTCRAYESPPCDRFHGRLLLQSLSRKRLRVQPLHIKVVFCICSHSKMIYNAAVTRSEGNT